MSKYTDKKWLAGPLFVFAALAAQPALAQVTIPNARVYAVTPGSGSFLGVAVAEVDSERAKVLRLKEEHGVEITRLEENSPASKAGLKVTDVVLEFNGQRVEGTEQFVRLVRETPPGRTVKMLISREGGIQAITATIGARKKAVFKGGDGDFRFSLPRMHFRRCRTSPACSCYGAHQC